MKFRSKIITAVFYLLALAASHLSAAELQIFEYEVKGKPKSKKKPVILAGVYAHDIATARNFDTIHKVLRSSVTKLNESGMVAGRHYFYSPDYFFFVPATKKEAEQFQDTIQNIAFELRNLDINSANRKIGSIDAVQRKIDVDVSRTTTTFLINEEFNAISFINYVATREKLDSTEENLKELRALAKHLKTEKKNIRRLVSKYKTFGALYDEMVAIKGTIDALMTDPSAHTEFKKLVFDTATEREAIGGGLDFSESRYPNRKLTYRQLESRMAKYSQDDKSMIQLKRYLLLLNVIFLNRLKLDELSKLTRDPYNEVVVLELMDVSETKSESNTVPGMKTVQTMRKGSYKLATFKRLDLGYGIALKTKQGKEAIVVFPETSKISDLKNLRNMDSIITKSISDSKSELAATKSDLENNPFHAKYHSVPFPRLLKAGLLVQNSISGNVSNDSKPKEKTSSSASANAEIAPGTEESIQNADQSVFDQTQWDLPVRAKYQPLLKEFEITARDLVVPEGVEGLKLSKGIQNMYLAKDGTTYLLGPSSVAAKKVKKKKKKH